MIQEDYDELMDIMMDSITNENISKIGEMSDLDYN